MLWPSRIDYVQAVGDYPHVSMLDPALKGGNPRRGANNYLMVYSGGFSTVFPVEVLSNTYALRCWIADIGDAETRYKEISNYLKQCRLPYFVDFAYVPEGIWVNGIKYPITRMEWAEGKTLCDFIKQNLQDTRCLKTAALEFQKMVAALHTHQISHGDLQDGNILLKRNGPNIKIKLIDYDSLFVPALRGQPDNIVGLPEYQHPQRIAGGGGANQKMDYFSELVIYLSLLALAAKPDLWSQFGDRTEKGLLFTVEDFKNPDQSDVFQELENLSPDAKQLTSKLKEFCKIAIDQLEPLEAVLSKTSLVQVVYDQGLAYLRSGRYNEAVIEFEKAIGLDSNYKEAYHGLGLVNLKMGNLGEAKKKAERALGIDPYYQPAHQLLDAIKSSSIPSSTGRPSTPTSTKSVSQVPKSQHASLNHWQYIAGALACILIICIAALATQTSAKDEALRKLQNQRTEQNKETKAQIAIVQQLRSEKEELRSQNRKLQNENKMLREQLGTRKLRPNPPPDNSNQLRVAPAKKIFYNSSPRVRLAAISKNNQGYIAFSRGQYNKATELFEDAIKSDPQSAIPCYNLGCTYLEITKYDKAINHLNRAIVLDPKFKEAHYNLALAFLRTEHHQLAMQVARKVLNIDNNYQPARQLLEAIE